MPGSGQAVFAYSQRIVPVQPGTLTLCWCPGDPTGISCGITQGFVGYAGTFVMIGPLIASTVFNCLRSHPCTIIAFGVGLTTDDDLIICGNPSTFSPQITVTPL